MNVTHPNVILAGFSIFKYVKIQTEMCTNIPQVSDNCFALYPPFYTSFQRLVDTGFYNGSRRCLKRILRTRFDKGDRPLFFDRVNACSVPAALDPLLWTEGDSVLQTFYPQSLSPCSVLQTDTTLGKRENHGEHKEWNCSGKVFFHGTWQQGILVGICKCSNQDFVLLVKYLLKKYLENEGE